MSYITTTLIIPHDREADALAAAQPLLPPGTVITFPHRVRQHTAPDPSCPIAPPAAAGHSHLAVELHVAWAVAHGRLQGTAAQLSILAEGIAGSHVHFLPLIDALNASGMALLEDD